MKYLNNIFFKSKTKVLKILSFTVMMAMMNISVYSQIGTFNLSIEVGNATTLLADAGESVNVPTTIIGSGYHHPPLVVNAAVHLRIQASITNTSTGVSYLVSDFNWDFIVQNDGTWGDGTGNPYTFTLDLPCAIPAGNYNITMEILDRPYENCSANQLCFSQSEDSNPCCTIYAPGGTDQFDVYISNDGGSSPYTILDGITGNEPYLPHTRSIGTLNVTSSYADLEIKVALEGAYDTATGEQNTALKSRGLLPGMTPISNLGTPTPAGQPYNTIPWNYTGQEGIGFTDVNYEDDDVDWVLVSLRTGVAKSTQIFETTGLLQANGEIRFFNCIDLASLTSSVYIVVEHRNHLPVMSAVQVPVTSGTIAYDFTVQDSYTANGTGAGQKEVATGIWAAFAGNFSQNALVGNPKYDRNDIFGLDFIAFHQTFGSNDGYFAADTNLDGLVDALDKNFVVYNNGYFSQIPQ